MTSYKEEQRGPRRPARQFDKTYLLCFLQKMTFGSSCISSYLVIWTLVGMFLGSDWTISTLVEARNDHNYVHTTFVPTSFRNPSHIHSNSLLSSDSKFMGSTMRLVFPPADYGTSKSRRQQLQPGMQSRCKNYRRTSSLGMFLGSDGGILGIGAPEVVVTLLVGYFVLGPSELYKLTKDIGKFIQNFRTLGSEATKSFESAMENQLEMKELRKARQELNDAFSFRRSINVSEDSEAFSTVGPQTVENNVGMAMDERARDLSNVSEEDGFSKKNSDGVVSAKIRKKRRIKMKTNDIKAQASTGDQQTVDSMNLIPDIDMNAEFSNGVFPNMTPLKTDVTDPFGTRDSKVVWDSSLTTPSTRDSKADWDSSLTTPSTRDTAVDWDSSLPTSSAIPDLHSTAKFESEFSRNATSFTNQLQEQQQSDRFAAQLSGTWNQRVLDKEEKLSPLAQVMEKLAFLEVERNVANKRLEEEFRLRRENDEKYYRQMKFILEDTAEKIASAAYGDTPSSSD